MIVIIMSFFKDAVSTVLNSLIHKPVELKNKFKKIMEKCLKFILIKKKFAKVVSIFFQIKRKISQHHNHRNFTISIQKPKEPMKSCLLSLSAEHQNILIIKIIHQQQLAQADKYLLKNLTLIQLNLFQNNRQNQPLHRKKIENLLSKYKSILVRFNFLIFMFLLRKKIEDYQWQEEDLIKQLISCSKFAQRILANKQIWIQN